MRIWFPILAALSGFAGLDWFRLYTRGRPFDWLRVRLGWGRDVRDLAKLLDLDTDSLKQMPCRSGRRATGDAPGGATRRPRRRLPDGRAQPEAGASLLAEAWRTYAGRDVFVDVPSDHAEAQASARAAGLTIQRQLTRMRRGDKIVEQLANLWATFGPEKG